MLQRLLDRLGMRVVPYLNLLVVPLMGLTSDSLPAVRAAATSAFAAAVALLPLAQVSHGRLTSVLTLIKQPRCLCSLRKHTAWVHCACKAERAVLPVHILLECLSSVQGIAPPGGLDVQQIVGWRKDAAFLTQLLDNTKVRASAATCICSSLPCSNISLLCPFL